MDANVTPLPRRRVGPGGILTGRQMQVVTLLAEGLTQKQIGARLHLGRQAVGTHVRRVRWALGASTSAHAVALAYQRGILQAGEDVAA
jgi:DNA-binding CsgD family transcriptional regulator